MASTIKDVARLAGVSISTVSRVTNGAENVSPELKKRVIKAVKALNYTPNVIARSLESRNARNIAIVMGRVMEKVFSNQSFLVILDGITKVLSAYGYNAVLTTESDKSKEVEHCIRLVRSGAIQGVIVHGSYVNDPLIARLLEEEIPFVLSGFPPAFPDVDTTPFNLVSIDACNSAKHAVEYLLQKGHRRIGLIHASLLRSVERRKYDGYIEAITEAGLRVDHTMICEVGYDLSDAVEAAKNMLCLKKRPTAIFCTDDQYAIGAINAAQALNLNVPTDLSIMGHNNYEMGRISTPTLTTVDVSRLQMGIKVGELIIAQLQDPTVRPQCIYLPISIVERQSVSKVPEVVVGVTD